MGNKNYYEVPESWIPYIEEMEIEIAHLIEYYCLPRDFVRYEQIKEKFNTLRVYVSFDYCLDLDDNTPITTHELYKCAEGMIICIVDRFEHVVNRLVKAGLLK